MTRLTTLAFLGLVACTATSNGNNDSSTDPNNPNCANGGACNVGGSSGGGSSSGGASSSGGGSSGGPTASATNGIKDGDETDVDCGGKSAPKCTEGKSCGSDDDCDVACAYDKKCVGAPSCAVHLGGDTCGEGEVEQSGPHESCCRTLPVKGWTDPSHPGKQVYLDKYEITAGRIRAWVAAMAKMYNGNPDVRTWIQQHRPAIWDDAWNQFLPSDWEGPVIVINRRLLGDPRPEDYGWGVGPGVIVPPPTDQPRHLGINYQFNSEVYVDLHGSDCGAYTDSYGFSTYFYPADILDRDGQQPRTDGTGYNGQKIPAQELLDVKAMNCIPQDMLAAFCAWDGGQLATDSVLDYITASPPDLGWVSGCGTQRDNHSDLLNKKYDTSIQTGGRCPAVSLINATFDAGDNLPEPNSYLNQHQYWYPDLGNQTYDKEWEVSAPGRASLATAANGKAVDAIAINPGDEPWMDLAGNLSESALQMNGASFSGLFTLKYRGIGYGSSRSDLNTTYMKGETVLRLQRPEAKAAYIGGRCMRFK